MAFTKIVAVEGTDRLAVREVEINGHTFDGDGVTLQCALLDEDGGRIRGANVKIGGKDWENWPEGGAEVDEAYLVEKVLERLMLVRRR